LAVLSLFLLLQLALCLLQVLARELTTLPNKIALEGHTDSTPYADH